MKPEDMKRQPFGDYRRESVLSYLAGLTEQYTQQLGYLQEELRIQEELVRELNRENERLYMSDRREQSSQEKDGQDAAL